MMSATKEELVASCPQAEYHGNPFRYCGTCPWVESPVVVVGAAANPNDQDSLRPWSDLRDTGVLWLINRVVFHPRGYALAIGYTGRFPDVGEALGWFVMGDGGEPWTMGEPTQEQISQGAKTEAELLTMIKTLLP